MEWVVKKCMQAVSESPSKQIFFLCHFSIFIWGDGARSRDAVYDIQELYRMS